MKFLAPFLMLFSFAASAAEPLPPLPQPNPPAEAAIHVTVVQTQAAEASLPVRVVPARKSPAPQGWLLLVAGLALAGWIAHRRLSYF